MFPTGDYERFEHEIGSVYRDYDIPITYGILIADMRQPACAEHIVNYLNRFHRLSNKYFDFFIPGYSFYGYRNGKKLDSCIDGKSLFFSDELFDEFVQKIEEILDIKYTYNPMLVLVEKKPNQKPNKDDKKIIIELDNMPGGVQRSGMLFEEIFDIAKEHVDIEEYSRDLTKTYIKDHILDEIVKCIDKKGLSILHSFNKWTQIYRIR